MKSVTHQEPTGCGITAVAAIAGVSYREANPVASSLGISAKDDRLWSDTGMVRCLLAHHQGRRIPSSPRWVPSWEVLPDCADSASRAIKWRRWHGRATWHSMVCVRETGRACARDVKRGLQIHRRRTQPDWYLPILATIR